MYKFMENENGKGDKLPVADASLISMRNIWKTYQMGVEELHALRGVSFDVKKGEYLAIIGPSGSGKSTLMNLIGCLDSPTKGEYWINGHQVAEMTDDELASKFHECAAWGKLLRASADKIVDIVFGLEKIKDIRELTRLLQTGRAAKKTIRRSSAKK